MIRAASAISAISDSSLTRRRSAIGSSVPISSVPASISSSSFARDLTLVFDSSIPTRPESSVATVGSISAVASTISNDPGIPSAAVVR